MNARSAARIAWTAAAVSAALGIGGLFFDWLGGLGMSSPVSSAYPMVWALSISLIGALVVSRQARNALGWLFTLVGLLTTFTFAGSVYADFTRTAGGRPWPAGPAIAWLSAGWLWIPIRCFFQPAAPSRRDGASQPGLGWDSSSWRASAMR